MKKLFLICIITFIGLSSFSQSYSIKGVIIDNQLQAVERAIISLEGKEVVTSGSDGSFTVLSNSKADTLTLSVSHMGYTEASHQIYCDTTLVVYLEPESVALDGVSVTAHRPVIEFRDGNLVANVDAIPGAESYTAAQLLSRLPGVKADDEKGLQLYGENVSLFVDGREQRIPAAMVVAYLQSLNASALDKIEIIAIGDGTTSATGSGKRINIITKRKKDDGYMLTGRYSVNRALQFPSTDAGGAMFYLLKSKDITFNSVISYDYIDYNRIQEDSTVYPSSSIAQEITNHSYENRYSATANLEWDIKNNHLLNISTMGYILTMDDNYHTPTAINVNNNRQSYINSSNSHSYADLWSANVEYASPSNKAFSAKASYGIVYGKDDPTTDYFQQADEEEQRGLYLQEFSKMKGHRHTFKTDFTYKPNNSGLTLRMGGQADLGKLNSSLTYDNVEIGGTVPYPDTYFDAEENIYAAYFRAAYKFNDVLNASASLRVENTDYSISNLSGATPTDNNYTNWFPYFQLNYNPLKNYSTIVALLSGINRPNYGHLLPGVQFSDNFSTSSGNPDLLPQTKLGIAWIHYFFQYAYIRADYARFEDTENVVVNINNEGIREYSYRNGADMDYWRMLVYLPFRFFNAKLMGDFTASFVHNKYINLRNGFEIMDGRESYWEQTFGANIYYKITDRLTLDASADYTPSYSDVYYDFANVFYIQFGARYALMKDERLSLALDFNNAFNTDRTKFVGHFDGAEQHRNSYRDNQLVRLSLSFQIGSNQQIKNTTGNNQNDVGRFVPE